MRLTNARETMNAIQTKEAAVKENKAVKAVRSIYAIGMAANAFAATAGISTAVAFAANTGGSEDASGGKGDNIMANIVKILLTISKWVGIGLVIFGIYEIVMSFMQQQPEAKTKGIVMALCGAVMIGIKPILQNVVPEANIS